MVVKTQPADIVLEDLTDDEVAIALRDKIGTLIEIDIDSLNSNSPNVAPGLRGEQEIAELIERSVVVDFVGFLVVPLQVEGEIQRLRFSAEPNFATVEHVDLTTTRIVYEVIND